MFGRMEAYKGLEVLIQAAQRLDERGAKVALDVRGAGPELDRLKEGFAGLASCEVHPGYASRDDLLAALAACDVVVAPYLQASGSGVAAAALANHRGLVASATGGLEAAVQPGVNGVLVPPGDAEALAAGLLEALDQAARLSRGAQALAAGPFAWRRAADTIIGRFQGPWPAWTGGVTRGRDAGLYAGGLLFQQVTAFVVGVAAARWLGPQGYGQVSLARAIYGLAVILAPLGLDLSLLRHLAQVDAPRSGQARRCQEAAAHRAGGETCASWPGWRCWPVRGCRRTSIPGPGSRAI